jgi:hypothetical protein
MRVGISEESCDSVADEVAMASANAAAAAEGTAQAAAAACVGKTCTAMFDFTGESAEYLTFREGDRILITDASSEWWRVSTFSLKLLSASSSCTCDNFWT